MDTHNKVHLAVEQLEYAIRFFLSRESYASSLTLAGAAEEILGKLRGKENALRKQYQVYIDPGLRWINPPKRWAEYAKELNHSRNALKHLSDENDLTFEADLEDDALHMLVRAIENYNRLGFNPTSRMKEFDEWFYENVIGI